MKRSEINDNLRLAADVFEAYHVALPRYAHWSPEQWKACGPEARGVRDLRLGWDVDDYGLGDFRQQGHLAFNLRLVRAKTFAAGNGAGLVRESGDLEEMGDEAPLPPVPPCGYAQRILLVQTGQTFPARHYVWRTCDLSNLGGGDVVFRIRPAEGSERTGADTNLRLAVNGFIFDVRPGGLLRLGPGESVSIPPGIVHGFWAESAGCVLEEIATPPPPGAADPFRFEHGVPKPLEIEEDEAPFRLLCHEYPEFE